MVCSENGSQEDESTQSDGRRVQAGPVRSELMVFAAPPPQVGYEPNLSHSALVEQIRGLLATGRRVERLLCRYLADLADRIRDRRGRDPFGLDDDIYDAARRLFGFGVRQTRERLRIGRALRELRLIEEAFVAGHVNYARVREITRVARPESEQQWLDLARTLPPRKLERRVAEAGAERETRSRRRDAPASSEWMSPRTVQVTMNLAPDAWDFLQRAMCAVKRSGDRVMTDSDAIEILSREAIDRLAGTEMGDSVVRVTADTDDSVVRTNRDKDASVVEVTAHMEGAVVCADGSVVETAADTDPSALEVGTNHRSGVDCDRPRGTAVIEPGAEDAGPLEHERIAGTRERSEAHLTPVGSLARMARLDSGDDKATEAPPSEAPRVTPVGSSARGRVRSARDDGGAVEVEYGSPAACAAIGVPRDREHVGLARLTEWCGDDLSVERAIKVLRAMGTRGGWHVDHLCAATGLGVPAVRCALLALEVTGHILRSGYCYQAA